VLDYHLHLWPHGTPASQPTLDELAAYCDKAAAAGVGEIALTEHLFRFVQADAALAGFWDDDPNPALREQMAWYWREHAHADLDTYVEAVLEAKAAGLPVVLGLEVDHYAGRMDKVAAVLDGYPFDVLLGSVHWIGAWGFDQVGDPVVDAEWDARGVEAVWNAYTEALEELAASRVCDVLAHPDLPKIGGRRPKVPDDFYDRMAEAAASSGMAAELSSAGYRKPVGEAYAAPAVVAGCRKAGGPATTASDAHGLPDVADHGAALRGLLADAGYETLTSFRSRRPEQVPI